ncbi:MAG: error-prone DNA polymerase [Spirochaetota bacterium]
MSRSPRRTYAPVWVKSNYSFLEGASHPDDLVREAARLGLPAVALTDRDGVYGIVQAHQAIKELQADGSLEGADPSVADRAAAQAGAVADRDGAGIRADEPLVAPPRLIVGSEVTVELAPGTRASIVLLAEDRDGYANLCGLISAGRMRSPKGESVVTQDEVCERARGLLALLPGSPAAAGQSESRVDLASLSRADLEERALGALRDAFADRLYLAHARHFRPGDRADFARKRELARRYRIPMVAATEVLYHAAERRELHDVLTCIRHGVTLNEAGSRLPANASHALLSAEEMYERYRDAPRMVSRTLHVAERAAFSLDEIDYRYPNERVPAGYTTSEWLWELAFAGARRRYGGTIPADVRSQLQKELALIDELEYGGYFLTMWEIVEYCRRQGILAQGRGSAANSAVCYCLGITAIDPVRMDLLFERFLSRERAEPPDIDVDIEHRRREEVIQHVYAKYGRERAAMVANVIRYRVKSAIRDVGKVLEIPATALDRMAKLASSRDSNLEEVLNAAGVGERTRRFFGRLVGEILEFPRHLSIHPGGFLLGSEPVHRLVPIENATMPDRTVIQWDKYDVEAMNLFKVDLLGLGALTHLDYCFRLLKQHRGVDLSMATIPHDDPAVFKLVGRGDTVGVFQLESRAQMAMLPRLRPKVWYDLVIEVSIVRPGPITGGMVHPYLRRRAGEEEVVYAHPDLEPVLKKTLGVPIFQEQVMKLAVVAADYSPGEADQLRRDMAAWRRSGRIEKHHERFVERMTAKGIEREFAEAVFDQIRGFGEYGFPESHAASFALIAYCTAWMRAHYPAEFVCGLLNAWPMGFYSPASIVEDAKRHGVEMLPIDVLASDWDCAIEPAGLGPAGSIRRTAGAVLHRNEAGCGPAGLGPAVRMGLRYVKGIGEADYRRIVRTRQRSHVDLTLQEFVRESDLSEEMLVALARAGGFGCFGLDRRQALWEVSGRRFRREQRLREARRVGGEGASSAGEMLSAAEALPDFDPLSDFELVAWDYYTSSHSTEAHPLEPHREALASAGHPSARELWRFDDGSRASYIGLVITRQRPATAGGTMFVTLEDETGYVNLVVWKKVFERFRPVLLTAAVLGVEGRIQAKDGVVHLVVDHCFKPQLSLTGFRIESRNFR